MIWLGIAILVAAVVAGLSLEWVAGGTGRKPSGRHILVVVPFLAAGLLVCASWMIFGLPL